MMVKIFKVGGRYVSNRAMEAAQVHVVGAPAPGAGVRGRLRSPGGKPLPARGAVPALAHRPGSRVLYLRTARGAMLVRSCLDPRVASGFRCKSAGVGSAL